MKKHLQYGFTILELLVVIGIIGILATLILVYLGGARTKANDASINHEISDLRSQASLYKGVAGASFVPLLSNQKIVAQTPGDLFTDATPEDASFFSIINGLPAGTWYYYGWDGILPTEGGHWLVAAALSDGAVCSDWVGNTIHFVGTSPTTRPEFKAAFPHSPAPDYLCN